MRANRCNCVAALATGIEASSQSWGVFLRMSLQGCHALLLEANHDPDMLQASAYPNFLKQRVAGPWGHLANHAAAELLARIKHDNLNYVQAAHLSERNNTPELARACLSAALSCNPLDIDVADPMTGSPWMNV